MKKLLLLHFAATCLWAMNTVYADDPIHDHGYWQGTDIIDQHVFDQPLADAMTSFFIKENAHTLVDFGCGMGDYVKWFLNANFYCEGYDGNPKTYDLSDGYAYVLDLSQPFNFGKKFDLVVSLEVGEHIPQRYETTFIDNLDRHVGKGIVLSWAVQGQGGFGHFNERDNSYIKKIMSKRGYVNDVETENFFRSRATQAWFQNTIMVFRKKGHG